MNQDLLARLRALLWEEHEKLSVQRWLLIRVGRYLFALGRDLIGGQLSMRAMSLVYTTLLSIVPLLALGFSVLKALGAHNSLEPVLLEFLSPLGPQSAELAGRIIAFVERIQVGVLGSLGVALLFYTSISLIQKVESSFNFIWRIERARPVAQRIGEYFGVLMVGPVLVFSALGLTATILNSEVVTRIAAIEPFGGLVYIAGKLTPYLIIIGLFSFLYAFLPNTRVKARAALAGGLAAGILWQFSSVAFAQFVASAGNYNAVYSGFAIFIFLLIWLYVGWLILLVGCQLAFYVQNPRHLEPQRRLPYMAGREAEFLALLVMAYAGQRFMKGERALTQDDLIRAIDAPPENVTRTIESLIQCGYLIETDGSKAQLMPSRDLDAIPLAELWQTVRGSGTQPRTRSPMSREVAKLIDEADACFAGVAGGKSLRDWLLQQARQDEPPSGVR